jgi:hypothetical protein
MDCLLQIKKWIATKYLAPSSDQFLFETYSELTENRRVLGIGTALIVC